MRSGGGTINSNEPVQAVSVQFRPWFLSIGTIS